MEKMILELQERIEALKRQERTLFDEFQQTEIPYKAARDVWHVAFRQLQDTKLKLQLLQEFKEQQEKGN